MLQPQIQICKPNLIVKKMRFIWKLNTHNENKEYIFIVVRLDRKSNRFIWTFTAAVPLQSSGGDAALTAAPSGCRGWTPGRPSVRPSTPAGWWCRCAPLPPPAGLPTPRHGYSSHLEHKHDVNNNNNNNNNNQISSDWMFVSLIFQLAVMLAVLMLVAV